jgi:CheY-like chemotaxis protein
MSRLLNALLDISKLESGAIKPHPRDFTVSELFEELRREFASLAAIKGLALLVEPCADRVCSDPSLMEQILRNLISNAIKYTHVGTVSLRCARQAGTVRIEVLDTGVGIPAEQMPYIFDEFFQIGITPNSTHDGYGLGLSIVSRLAKLLNAVLEVQSELGRGTSFSIELPAGVHHVGSEHTAAGPAPRAVEAVREGRRVLLVEDDAAVRNATRMLLRAGGYEVFTAGSHTEALQKLHEHQSLDLLITDYHLGSGETGVQVINSMRAALGAEFKAILITGDTSPQIKGLSLDEHLRVASKPIQADELLLLIRELLTS